MKWLIINGLTGQRLNGPVRIETPSQYAHRP